MAKSPYFARKLSIWAVVAMGGLTAACGSDGADTSSIGGQRYSAERVTGGCDLLDLSVLARWEPTPINRSGDKKNTELGTELTCDAENNSVDTDRLAAVELWTVLHTDKSEALTTYEMNLVVMKRLSGVNAEVAVPGLGERAAYLYEKKDSDSNGRSTLQLSLLDGPLVVRLIISVDAAPTTEQELLAVATDQMRRISNTLEA
ncbi:hypothetical protein [Nocardia altamirensis]|uniref:hypothetical protein n=1 Tax=Nocardia altamirensis TaxID=472158 RepID=UPI0008402E6A|nr:hypothetical protein [Nocardia altamirensis]